MSNKGIVVIGMHRSGTSALSGELARLGVFMGEKLIKSKAGVNDKGFWENHRLLRINEKLLERLVSSWDNPVATSEHCLSLLSDRASLQIGEEFIQNEYAGYGLWGMKEPRVSILLPYWKKVFEQIGVKPFYLFMLRNPAEVVGSLIKRDVMSQQKGLMLWLNYNFSCYWETLKENVLLIDFADLTLTPECITDQIAKFCGINFGDLSSDQSFIDKKLKRQQHDQIVLLDQSGLYEIADKLYHALKAGDQAEINRLYGRYKDYLDALNPVLLEHIKLIKKSEVHFRNVFEEAYYSKYWKFLKGMLKLEKNIAGLR